MINELDEALRSLVKAEVLNGADVEILFDAPNRDWAARRNTPTVDLYLYDIREDTKRRSTGMIERRDERGTVVDRQALPRYFKLAYLITAWTQRPEDEHRLLSALLACFMRFDTIPRNVLPPMLADLDLPIGAQIAYPPAEDRQVHDIWSSLGGDLKPSLDLVITFAMQPQRLYDIAKAVMAPLRLHAVGQNTMDVEDTVKHLPETHYGSPSVGEDGAAATGGGGATGAGGSRRSRT